MTIQEAIRQIALRGLEMHCKVCAVDSVDEAARTVDCTPIDEGAPLIGVNLQAGQEGDDGVLLLPAIGSYVVVAFLGDAAAVVVATEKIDKATLKIGDTTVEVDSVGIIVNGGKMDGLVKINTLTDKLNALENDINDLKTAFASWIVAPQDGGGALKTAAAKWFAKTITATQKTELEDEQIKH